MTGPAYDPSEGLYDSGGSLTVTVSNILASEGIHSGGDIYKEAISERKLYQLESVLSGIPHDTTGAGTGANYQFRTPGWNGGNDITTATPGTGPYFSKDAQRSNGARILGISLRNSFNLWKSHGHRRNTRICTIMLCLKAASWNMTKAADEVAVGPCSVIEGHATSLRTLIENSIPSGDVLDSWQGDNPNLVNYSNLLMKQLFSMPDTQILAAAAAAEQYAPWNLASNLLFGGNLSGPSADLLDEEWTRKSIKLILRNLVNGKYPKQGTSVYCQPTRVNDHSNALGAYYTRNQRPWEGITWFGAFFNEIWGQNLKIVTIGLPAGFVDRLKSETPATLSDPLKELPFQDPDHLIEIKLYKIDLEFPDIVFYPKTFYFNTRMFVTPPVLVWRHNHRDADVNYLANNSGQHSKQCHTAIGRLGPKMKVFNVPTAAPASPIILTGRRGAGWYSTQSHGAEYANGACPVEFLWLKRAQEASIGTTAGAGLVEMIENHQIDFALRMYIKYMTGCDITETTFPAQDVLLDLAEPVEVRRNINEFISRYITQASSNTFDVDFLRNNAVFNSLFHQIESVSPSTAAIASDAINAAMLSATGDKNLEISEALKNFLSLFGRESLFSGGARIKRKILSPKKFDRVFHVCVDPDDFEVNYSATTDGPGNEAINYFGGSTQIIGQDASGRYWMKPRNPHNGYVEVSQFFATVSTVDDDLARDILCLP